MSAIKEAPPWVSHGNPESPPSRRSLSIDKSRPRGNICNLLPRRRTYIRRAKGNPCAWYYRIPTCRTAPPIGFTRIFTALWNTRPLNLQVIIAKNNLQLVRLRQKRNRSAPQKRTLRLKRRRGRWGKKRLSRFRTRNAIFPEQAVCK